MAFKAMLLLLLLSQVHQSLCCSGFFYSCKDPKYSLDTDILEADCSGESPARTLLDNTLTNLHGSLAYGREGGFRASCNNITLVDSNLEATCATGGADGKPTGQHRTSIDLNSYISNEHGNFVICSLYLQ
ncbi:hypothetical protein SELMODRAFT_415071 [Selaginella moellendorffii]|uniref:Cyanovirin-N domain-containing protein n=1 Tax=Selaginella moellendorffii TaxID=88036 RepID=D8RUX5_SELML|nr:hypothetical protein SELMODRAFT_415071 [Selaginella moellendorffii]